MKNIIIFLLLFSIFICLNGCEKQKGKFGKNAYLLCKAVADIGPRPSGSDNLEKVRKLISLSLERADLKVERDNFTCETPVGSVDFVNISSLKKGKNNKRIIIAAHYESKLFEDFKFIGANDNASGTAVLMVLASEFKNKEFNYDIEYLFLDGEESFKQWSPSDSLYGSRRRSSLIKNPENIKAFILIDMIGKKNLQIDFEGFSDPNLSALLEDAAEETGNSDILSQRMIFLEDDHIPFANIGIPSIDIIDFSFPEWHTENDDMNCISEESLEKAGYIIMRFVEKIDSGN